MNTVIASTVLHLVGTGSDGSDPYLRPGRHLRWFPNPVIGFPRRGFVLHRRPSPAWPWTKNLQAVTARVDNGSGDDGAWNVPAWGAGDEERLRITSPAGAVSLAGDGIEVGQAGLMLETFDGNTPRPFAWLAVQLDTSRVRSAVVSATAWSSGSGEQSAVARVSARVTELATWYGEGHPHDHLKVLIIDGGQADALEIHTSGGVRLTAASWLSSARYVDVDGWTAFARVLLPIDGDNTTYPAQSGVDQVVKDRIATGAASAAPPWATPAWPPPTRSEGEARSDGAARLMPHVPILQSELTRVLAEELNRGIPQGLIDPETTTMDVDGGGTASFETRPIPLILGAALELPVAHLLGLAAVDTNPSPDIPYDYCVTAWYPTAWLIASLLPSVAESWTENPLFDEARTGFRPALIPPLPPREMSDEQTSFRKVASLATALFHAPLAPVTPPANLRVQTISGRGISPVGVDTELTWTTEQPAGISEGPVVAATQVRTDNWGRVPLARTDPLSGQKIPMLSGLGDHAYHDRSLRVTGQTSWDVHHYDIWGRWSPPAQVELEVLDNIAPPPPSALQAHGFGPPDARQQTVPRLDLAFEWTPAHMAIAPDTSTFVVQVVGGEHEAEDAIELPGTEVEIPVDSDSPLSARETLPDGSVRYTVRLSDVPAVEQGTTWISTAVVRARDTRGNASSPVAQFADVIEEARPDTPPGLPGVSRCSWPDPDGYGWFRVHWSSAPGQRVQVLRTAGAALLSRAGVAREDGDDRVYAEQLRALAVDHPHAFVPDHPRSYDDGVDQHDVQIVGSTRDLAVVVIVPTGPTGSRATWPTNKDSFTVIGARRLSAVAAPRFTAKIADTGGVALTVRSTVDEVRIRLWRASDDVEPHDVRRMTPLPPVTASATGETTIVDSNVMPGTWYAYRASIDVPDGRRSEPTEPVWVRTRDS